LFSISFLELCPRFLVSRCIHCRVYFYLTPHSLQSSLYLCTIDLLGLTFSEVREDTLRLFFSPASPRTPNLPPTPYHCKRRPSTLRLFRPTALLFPERNSRDILISRFPSRGRRSGIPYFFSLPPPPDWSQRRLVNSEVDGVINSPRSLPL